MSNDFYVTFSEAARQWDIFEVDTDDYIGSADSIPEIAEIVAAWVKGRTP
jgi:hypothetical protein